MLYIAPQSEAHWQWQKCNLVSCERNRLAFCHATPGIARLLMAGSQQGRTKRLLTIGGPCRAQNLRSMDKGRAPSSGQVLHCRPSSFWCVWCVHSTALHCSARLGHGEQRSRVCSLSPKPTIATVDEQVVKFCRLPYRTVPYRIIPSRSTRDSPRLDLGALVRCAIVVL